MHNRFQSLRVKLLLVLLPSVLLALGLSFSFSAHNAKEQFNLNLEQKRESLTQYSTVLVDPLWNFNTNALESITHTIMLDPDVLQVTIWDEGNNIVHQANSPLKDNVEVAFSLEEPLIYQNAHITQRAGTLRVKVGNLSLKQAEQRDLYESLLSLLLIVVTMSLAIYMVYERLLGGPIQSLLSAIKHSQAEQKFARVNHYPDDELGEITRAFNEMQGRIEQHHSRLKSSEDHLKNLYHSTPSLLFSFDEKGVICDASDYFLKALGYHREQIINQPLTALTRDAESPETVKRLINMLWKYGLVSKFPLVILDAAGTLHDMLIDATLSASDTFPGALAVMSDVTSLKQAHRELDLQANTDMLSGLPNRNQFQAYLESLVNERQLSQQPFALLFIDLDRFKSVNDTFGHHVGDELIRAAAQRIQQELQGTERVARLGGDEFAVILEQISSPEDATATAQRILQALEDAFKLPNCKVYASASIGVACYPVDADTPATLLQNADIAMYSAKDEGRSRIAFYSPEHVKNAQERAHTEALLRRAIRDNLLELHYQPIVNMKNGTITGAEALLRLKDSDRFISPFHFIPIAEETGLITPIGAWCIEQACAQLAHWRKHLNDDFYLSVNVSTRQFQSEHLVETLEQSLAQHRLPPDSLLIEITESLLLHDNQNNLTVISQLDKLGCRIAIDDFGTGYSALSYLMKFPLDVLKIDRSFIINCTNQEDGKYSGLVEAIIQMSHSMSLKVITEGIETREQMEFIRARGGRCAQGYYFAKPMRADALESDWEVLSDEIEAKCASPERVLLTEALA
ncbi:EAL domain-containing protein [Pontibacterium granulatum]|uniref:EAL domain-containing protein n=1 Tax=Pontibacterium granulatum TaxID=2036029 RepID=UPI00249AEDBD|nr:EAL domain-containing protein [Pontibacterium granulatum]MDI3325645.1 EAL domain-containing protein [Pontibacterium granulatum]